MKKFLAMAAALTMSLSVAAAASAEKYQMTFSTAVSQEQSSTIYMDKALDLITERTNGDVTFSRTYSGTLGSEHDLGVMCQSGDIDIVCIGPASGLTGTRRSRCSTARSSSPALITLTAFSLPKIIRPGSRSTAMRRA